MPLRLKSGRAKNPLPQKVSIGFRGAKKYAEDMLGIFGGVHME